MKSLHLTRPYAIMTVGIPGSGKSFFAQGFAKTFNVPRIDFNEIDDSTENPEKAGQLALSFLTELAKTQQTFLFEGNSATRTHRSEFARVARSLGYTPLFIWVQLDQATASRRVLKSREYTKETFLAALRAFSPPHASEKPLVISGTHTFASQAKVVLKYLSGENRTSQSSIAPPAREVVAQPAAERPAPERPSTGRRNINVR